MTTNTEAFYKVLNLDGSCYYGGTGSWVQGEWREVTGELIPCENGLHVLTRDQLVYWLGPRIDTVEAAPDTEMICSEPDKTVVRRARTVSTLTTWTSRTQRLFAADCAERALDRWWKNKNNRRPYETLAVVRRFANGQATEEELAAAYAANAAYAAYPAARAAAHAAYPAARAADRAGHPAARVAAHAAYAANAAHAAYAAAAFYAVERAWQSRRLWYYLEGEQA